ncbi:MAG TPA: DnaD domain protein [Eubacteriales bacterium]|nr:DnaD domain protein [Clostridia bacterium]HRV72624.1 DnaD domain protein [Eubacteriales bacterium]
MLLRFAPEALRRELTPLDNLFITEFLPEADGEAVKVYIYGLMQCFHSSMREISIADALLIPKERVLAHFVYWQAKGLVRISSDEPLTVEYLSTLQPAVTTATAVKYRAFVQSLNAVFAPRELVMRELKVMYDCIELYGLEEGAALELAAYCVEQKGKRVSLNYVLAVAQTWSERGITTPAQAVEYINDDKLLRHGASEVLRRWNKRRKPTEDEIKLYDRWVTEWGFDSEAILAACPQLVGVATPTFEILNDRLRELYIANKLTRDDIEGTQADLNEDREFCRLVFARMGKVEPPSKTNIAQVAAFVHEKGMPREVILLAADECLGADRPFGKLKTILLRWSEAGVDSIEKGKEELAKFSSKGRAGVRSVSRRTTAYGYEQHTVTDKDFTAALVDLNEDIT